MILGERNTPLRQSLRMFPNDGAQVAEMINAALANL
jgi:hypothetical protein